MNEFRWTAQDWGQLMKEVFGMDPMVSGAYVNLKIGYMTEGGALNSNEKKLQNLSKLKPAQWRKYRDELAAKFVVGAGVWRHVQWDREITESLERIASNQDRTAAARQAKQEKQRAGAAQKSLSVVTSEAESHVCDRDCNNDTRACTCKCPYRESDYIGTELDTSDGDRWVGAA